MENAVPVTCQLDLENDVRWVDLEHLQDLPLHPPLYARISYLLAPFPGLCRSVEVVSTRDQLTIEIGTSVRQCAELIRLVIR
jgi:hypothetical protein